MNYLWYTAITILIAFLLFVALFFRKSKFPRKRLVLYYLFSIALPLVIPYPWIEKILFDYLAGLPSALLISLILILIEWALLLFLIMKAHQEKVDSPEEKFFLFLLLGLGFGLGKALRDTLLVYFHSLSVFYGYSQFANFPSFFYLLQKIMEAQIEVISAGLLGLAFLSPAGYALHHLVSYSLLSFIPKGLITLVQVLIQFVPSLSFLASVYLISLLPLTLIIGFGLLWYLYRRRLYQIIEEGETSPHKENFKGGA